MFSFSGGPPERRGGGGCAAGCRVMWVPRRPGRARYARQSYMILSFSTIFPSLRSRPRPRRTTGGEGEGGGEPGGGGRIIGDLHSFKAVEEEAPAGEFLIVVCMDRGWKRTEGRSMRPTLLCVRISV